MQHLATTTTRVGNSASSDSVRSKMKSKSVRYRLSPNEEARLIQQENEKRRKTRLLQVRELSKQNATKIRKSVKAEKQKQIQQLAVEVEDEMENEKAEKVRHLEAQYNNCLRTIGMGHKEASEQYDRSEERQILSQEDSRRAEIRYRKALETLKDEKERKNLQENAQITARQSALEAERRRAAQVASLPPPPPDPTIELGKVSHKPVKLTDLNAFSQTHYHIPAEYVVDKADPLDQIDARALAQEEAGRIQEEHDQIQRSHHERLEKARVRHKVALDKELLKQDYQQMLHDLSDLQRADMHRRQKIVANIPKQVFQPPHRRLEDREDKQRTMEQAFEDMYMQATHYTGDLSMALDPYAPPDTPTVTESLDLSIMTSEMDNNVNGVADSQDFRPPLPSPARRAEILKDVTNSTSEGGGSKKSDTVLKKLLHRIKNQRDEWVTRSIQDVPEQEQFVSASPKHSPHRSALSPSPGKTDPGFPQRNSAPSSPLKRNHLSPSPSKLSAAPPPPNILLTRQESSPPVKSSSRDRLAGGTTSGPVFTNERVLVHPAERAEHLRSSTAPNGERKGTNLERMNPLEQHQKFLEEAIREQQEIQEKKRALEARLAELEKQQCQGQGQKQGRQTLADIKDDGNYGNMQQPVTANQPLAVPSHQPHVQNSRHIGGNVKSPVATSPGYGGNYGNRQQPMTADQPGAPPSHQSRVQDSRRIGGNVKSPLVTQPGISSNLASEKQHSVLGASTVTEVNTYTQDVHRSTDDFVAGPIDDGRQTEHVQRIREYQERLLEKQQESWKMLAETRSEITRRREELMRQYPQLSLPKLEALDRPTIDTRNIIQEGVPTEPGMLRRSPLGPQPQHGPLPSDETAHQMLSGCILSNAAAQTFEHPEAMASSVLPAAADRMSNKYVAGGGTREQPVTPKPDNVRKHLSFDGAEETPKGSPVRVHLHESSSSRNAPVVSVLSPDTSRPWLREDVMGSIQGVIAQPKVTGTPAMFSHQNSSVNQTNTAVPLKISRNASNQISIGADGSVTVSSKDLLSESSSFDPITILTSAAQERKQFFEARQKELRQQLEAVQNQKSSLLAQHEESQQQLMEHRQKMLTEVCEGLSISSDLKSASKDTLPYQLQYGNVDDQEIPLATDHRGESYGYQFQDDIIKTYEVENDTSTCSGKSSDRRTWADMLLPQGELPDYEESPDTGVPLFPGGHQPHQLSTIVEVDSPSPQSKTLTSVSKSTLSRWSDQPNSLSGIPYSHLQRMDTLQSQPDIGLDTVQYRNPYSPSRMAGALRTDYSDDIDSGYEPLSSGLMFRKSDDVTTITMSEAKQAIARAHELLAKTAVPPSIDGMALNQSSHLFSDNSSSEQLSTLSGSSSSPGHLYKLGSDRNAGKVPDVRLSKSPSDSSELTQYSLPSETSQSNMSGTVRAPEQTSLGRDSIISDNSAAWRSGESLHKSSSGFAELTPHTLSTTHPQTFSQLSPHTLNTSQSQVSAIEHIDQDSEEVAFTSPSLMYDLTQYSLGSRPSENMTPELRPHSETELGRKCRPPIERHASSEIPNRSPSMASDLTQYSIASENSQQLQLATSGNFRQYPAAELTQYSNISEQDQSQQLSGNFRKSSDQTAGPIMKGMRSSESLSASELTQFSNSPTSVDGQDNDGLVPKSDRNSVEGRGHGIHNLRSAASGESIAASELTQYSLPTEGRDFSHVDATVSKVGIMPSLSRESIPESELTQYTASPDQLSETGQNLNVNNVTKVAEFVSPAMDSLHPLVSDDSCSAVYNDSPDQQLSATAAGCDQQTKLSQDGDGDAEIFHAVRVFIEPPNVHSSLIETAEYVRKTRSSLDWTESSLTQVSQFDYPSSLSVNNNNNNGSLHQQRVQAAARPKRSSHGDSGNPTEQSFEPLSMSTAGSHSADLRLWKERLGLDIPIEELYEEGETGISDEPDLTMASVISDISVSRPAGDDSQSDHGDESLVSFEHHEESLSDTRGSVHSGSTPLKDSSVVMCIGPEAHKGPSTHGVSLQEAFLARKPGFPNQSKKRASEMKEKVKANPASSGLSKTLVSWKKSRGIKGTVSSKASPKKMMKSKVAAERKKDEKETIRRTQRLYSQLEEVKERNMVKEREEQYAANRDKAKEYHKKMQEKLKKSRDVKKK